MVDRIVIVKLNHLNYTCTDHYEDKIDGSSRLSDNQLSKLDTDLIELFNCFRNKRLQISHYPLGF